MKWNEMRKGISRMLAILTAAMVLLAGSGIPAAAAEGELICGLPEHEHTDACFERTLICGLEESAPVYAEERHFVSDFQVHFHTAACLDSEGNALCGLAENAYFHEHNAYCYDENGNLVCGLQNIPRHYHSDACYSVVLGLACGETERDPVFDPETAETIDAGHYHTADCYSEVWTLTCDYAKVHEHSDSCYNGYGSVICGYVSVPEFVCSEANWVSEQHQTAGHQHSAACYQVSSVPVCGMKEHHHTDGCYMVNLVPVNDAAEETETSAAPEGTETAIDVPEITGNEENPTENAYNPIEENNEGTGSESTAVIVEETTEENPETSVAENAEGGNAIAEEIPTEEPVPAENTESGDATVVEEYTEEPVPAKNDESSSVIAEEPSTEEPIPAENDENSLVTVVEEYTEEPTPAENDESSSVIAEEPSTEESTPAENDENSLVTVVEKYTEHTETAHSTESDNADTAAQVTDSTAPVEVDVTPAAPSTSEQQTETLVSDASTAASIEIVMQPENASGAQGDTVRLNTVAIGDGLTYQWQQSTDGIDWTDISIDSNAFFGAQTSELSFTVEPNTANWQYRCVISNGAETVTTFAVTAVIVEEAPIVYEEEPKQVTVEEPAQDQPEVTEELVSDTPDSSDPVQAGTIEIVKQPENVVGKEGDTIRFTVEASGSGLTYQWQRTNKSGEWGDIRGDSNASFSGALTPELSFTATSSTLSKEYRCIVSDGEESLTTQSVKVLEAEEAPAVAEETEPVEPVQNEAEQVEAEILANDENTNTADLPIEDDADHQTEAVEGEVSNPETEKTAADESEEEDIEAGKPEEEKDEADESEEDSEAGESEKEKDEADEPEEKDSEAAEGEDGDEQEAADEESEQVELPTDRSVDFVIEWDEENPSIGSIAHFKVILNGYDQLVYTLQWQYSEDGETWQNLEGETGMNMDQEITMDNYEYFWRIEVNVLDILQGE